MHSYSCITYTNWTIKHHGNHCLDCHCILPSMIVLVCCLTDIFWECESLRNEFCTFTEIRTWPTVDFHLLGPLTSKHIINESLLQTFTLFINNNSFISFKKMRTLLPTSSMMCMFTQYTTILSVAQNSLP